MKKFINQLGDSTSKGATLTTTPVAPCSHKHIEYIDAESETNIQQAVICEDCGKDVTEDYICD